MSPESHTEKLTDTLSHSDPVDVDAIQLRRRVQENPTVDPSYEVFLNRCFNFTPGWWVRLLAADVKSKLRKYHRERDNHPDEPEKMDEVEMATYLCSVGFSARVACTKDEERNRALHSAARHVFLVIDSPPEFDDPPVIVDLSFRDQFKIPRPTPRYTAIINIVPDVFVGRYAHLICGAKQVCKEMRESMTFRDIGIPPWRKESAMLARWSYSVVNQ